MKIKRFLSAVLAVAMLLTMLPAAGITASAADDKLIVTLEFYEASLPAGFTFSTSQRDPIIIGDKIEDPTKHEFTKDDIFFVKLVAKNLHTISGIENGGFNTITWRYRYDATKLSPVYVTRDPATYTNTSSNIQSSTTNRHWEALENNETAVAGTLSDLGYIGYPATWADTPDTAAGLRRVHAYYTSFDLSSVEEIYHPKAGEDICISYFAYRVNTGGTADFVFDKTGQCSVNYFTSIVDNDEDADDVNLMATRETELNLPLPTLIEQGYADDNTSKDISITMTSPAAKHTLTYDANANGDTVTNMPDPAEVDVEENVAYTLSTATPSRSGYAFMGWAESADSTTPITSPVTLTADKTVYAIWEEVIPNATGLTSATQKAIDDVASILASNAKNTSDADLMSLLPATGKVTTDVAGLEEAVKLEWTKTSTDAFNAKGGTYTYKATVTAPTGSKLVIPATLVPTATITVSPVTVAWTDITENKNVSIGSTVTLPATGKIKADDNATEVTYDIAWNTSTVDTSVATTTPIKVEGTVTFNNAPAWLTVPTGTCKITYNYNVVEKTIKEIKDLTPITIDADAAENADLAALIASLPDVKVIYDGETAETELETNWKLTDGTFAPTGGTYTFKDEDIAAGEKVAEVKVTVNPVTIPVGLSAANTMFVAPTTEAYADYAAIGLTASGTLNDSKENTYNYTIEWEGAIPEGFGTTEGAEATFTGKVTYTDKDGKAVPAWLTVGDKMPATITTTVKVESIEAELSLEKDTVRKNASATSAVYATVNGEKVELVEIVSAVSADTEYLTVEIKDNKLVLNGEKVSDEVAVELTVKVKYNDLVIDVTDEVSVEVKKASTGGGGGGGGSSRPVISITPSAPAKVTYFDDIDHIDWAVDQINALAEKGFVQGVSHRIFAPDDNVTRAEFTKMLVEIFGLTEADENMSFTDMTDTSAWYYDYVAIGTKAGVVLGYGDKTFRPGANISRAEMAAMLGRACKAVGLTLPELVELEVFDDADDIPEYARGYIEELQKASIINGMGDGTYEPEGKTKRAQAAKVAWEVYELYTAQ